MHFAVIGTGGIGGYYGARLQAHGQLVTFIARGAHLQALQTGGLRVNHPEWRFDAPVRACSLEQFFQSSLTSEVDLIILCVKAIDTQAIARQLADGLGESSAPVLSLQNGVDNEAVLARHLGREAGPGRAGRADRFAPDRAGHHRRRWAGAGGAGPVAGGYGVL